MMVAAGIVILSVIAVLFLRPRRRRRTRSADADYAAALEALVRGREEEAIERLIASAKRHPSSLNAYLVLGDVFRRRGDLQKAVRVHHELSIRPGLGKGDLEEVCRSLTRDYLALRQYGRAARTAERLLSMSRKDRFALESLLEAYEGLGDWNRAIETARVLANRVRDDGKRFLARYHAHAGWNLMKSDPGRAEGLFKKARSLDPDCIEASIFMGDIHAGEGRYDRAISLWNDMIERDPKTFHHVVDRLERAYFESGQYSRMMELYERLHKRIPGDILVLLGMARMSLKKGDHAGAVRYVEEAREADPGDLRIYPVYIEVHQESGDPETALKACRDCFDRVLSTRSTYVCTACGSRSDTLLLRCPECGGWELALAGPGDS
jgi:lipopolysaccharide biosynthesis regulator YciM